MANPITSRAQARRSQTETIKALSRELIAEKGVAGLSLREVSRKMGVVSSALYRYFPTRDDLLTALILDAYNDLGSVVERADARSSTGSSRQRWLGVALAIRRWAKRHPPEYALIYGTPVPNYKAPQLTIEAASRVTRVIGRILSDDRKGKATTSVPDVVREELGSFLELDNLGEHMPYVAPSDYVLALMAWTEIFGFLSFELFGHYVGSVRNASKMFERVMSESASRLGLD